MLSFWPSDLVLISTQAALVLGPRPPAPAFLHRLRSGAWAWVLPISLGGTVALVAAFPGLAPSLTYLSLVALPILAIPALATWRGPAVGVAAAATLFALSWVAQGSLIGQGAAVAITALSCATLASYLCAVAPPRLVKVAIVVMAALDAYLVFGQLLEAPNNAINAASPGSGLPQLQMAAFGSALVGYGDLLIAATLGGVLVSRTMRRRGALLVLGCSVVFDLLFLVVGTLPATVPVAAALVILEVRARRVRSGARTVTREAPV
ncbi:MAG: hypothetical protein WAV00_05845 [Nocardioides sp.]